MTFVHRGRFVTVLTPAETADQRWRAIVSDRGRPALVVVGYDERDTIARTKAIIDRALGIPLVEPWQMYEGNPLMPAWFRSEVFGSALVLGVAGLGVISALAWLFSSKPVAATPPPPPAPVPPGGGSGGYGIAPGQCDPGRRPAECPPEAAPPGFKVWNGKSNAAQVRDFAQNYLLAEPLGAWVDFQIGNNVYKGHLECHYHSPGFPGATCWHKGATVYEKVSA